MQAISIDRAARRRSASTEENVYRTPKAAFEFQESADEPRVRRHWLTRSTRSWFCLFSVASSERNCHVLMSQTNFHLSNPDETSWTKIMGGEILLTLFRWVRAFLLGHEVQNVRCCISFCLALKRDDTARHFRHERLEAQEAHNLVNGKQNAVDEN